ALIIAHKNVFNQYILGKDALFFQDINEIHAAVESIEKNAVDKKNMRQNNLLKVQKYYSWEHVLSEYESYFKLVRPGRETASSS
ncbi:MAG: glycosyltransferase, partial [Bacteroidota bacterium]